MVPPSGSRKRAAPILEPEIPEEHAENDHVIDHDQKRLREDGYSPSDTEIVPINSNKRRAASQDPDCEQSITQKSVKRVKIDPSSDAVPSGKDEDVSQVPDDQDFEELVNDNVYDSDSGEEDEDDNSDIPANPPTKGFFVQPPGKDLSWTKGQYAPTLPYVNALTCPIDWTYVKSRVPYLTNEHVQAYEFREPWAVNGEEVEYETIVELFHAAGDNSVNSLEGARKRFSKANLAVFRATGVWFEGSTPGLKEFGIKGRTAAELQQDQAGQTAGGGGGGNDVADADADDNDDEPENPLPVKEELGLGDNIITFVLQPPRQDVEDRCLECCKLGLCYDKECRNGWLKFRHRTEVDSGYDSDDTDFEAEDVQDEDDPYHAGYHSSRRWAHVLTGKKHAPFGCPVHQPLTLGFVHAEKFEAVCESPTESTYIMDVSHKAFSLFASCFAPQFLGEFPENPQRLDVSLDQEDAGHGKEFTEAVYEDVGDFTVADIFEAYCCSQSLNCPAVSDVLLSHLRTIVQGSEFSLKSFAHHSLRYVFRCTNASDPIRLFLFDAFRLNMAEGKDMMRHYRDLYPQQLVRYWDHWERQQRQKISPRTAQRIENFHAEGWRGERGAATGLRGIFYIVPEPDEHPDDQEGVIWGNCIFQGWSRRMGKLPSDWLSREALHERFTQSDSVQALSSDDGKLFWATYRNRSEDDN